jgi:phosphoheptose isomerase
MNVKTVMLTSTKYVGSQGDYILKVPSTKTEQIQHAHTAIGHIICELIESSLLA